MSDATLRLLESPETLFALAVGVALAAMWWAWSRLLRTSLPYPGMLLLAVTILTVLADGRIGLAGIMSVCLVAVSAMIWEKSRVGAATVLAIASGLVAWSSVGYSQYRLAFFVAVATGVGSVIVASFTTRTPTSRTLPLLAVAYLGVFVSIPSTEAAVLAASVMLGSSLGSPMLKLPLSRPATFGLVGLLMWIVGAGGGTRPSSIFGSVAALGLLLAAPTASYLWRGRSGHLSVAAVRPGAAGMATLMSVQILTVTATARIAGLANSAVAGVNLAALALALAVVWSALPLRYTTARPDLPRVGGLVAVAAIAWAAALVVAATTSVVGVGGRPRQSLIDGPTTVVLGLFAVTTLIGSFVLWKNPQPAPAEELAKH